MVDTNIPENPVNIPNEDDVQATGLGGAWRFANGKIRKGRQGAFEDRPSQKVVGLLRRVGIHSGKRQSDGVPFSQIECDIETANGIEHFKSSLTDDEGRTRPSSATVGLAWGLIELCEDMEAGTYEKNPRQIMLTVSEADFTTERGGKPTFVNVWESPKADWKFQQLIRPKRDRNAAKVEITDQWLALEADFKKHPAFAERAAREEDNAGPSHLSGLNKLCEELGWPSPSQAPGAWLTRIAQIAQPPEAPKAKLTDIEDHTWGEVILLVRNMVAQGRTGVPAFLEAAAPAPEQKPLGDL